MLVGSANFTNQAFTRNTEATALVAHDDVNASIILKAGLSTIDESWDAAGTFTQSELKAYRATWQNQKPKADSLSGQYGGTQPATKPIYQATVATMTWRDFVKRVQSDPFHSLSGRLRVVEKARAWFEKNEHFSDMTDDQRKFVAGLPNALNTDGIDAGWSGSMKGNGKFRARIARNDANISRALDHIPLYGQLTKAHFDRFIQEYQKAFRGKFVAMATRLLAMKRPDTFVCFDSRNKAQLCKAFGIRQAGMDYERYWDEVVQRIFDSEWWLHPRPVSEEQRKVSEARAAFLDSLYYEPSPP